MFPPLHTFPDSRLFINLHVAYIYAICQEPSPVMPIDLFMLITFFLLIQFPNFPCILSHSLTLIFSFWTQNCPPLYPIYTHAYISHSLRISLIQTDFLSSIGTYNKKKHLVKLNDIAIYPTLFWLLFWLSPDLFLRASLYLVFSLDHTLSILFPSHAREIERERRARLNW